MTSNQTCWNAGTGLDGAADNEAVGEGVAGGLNTGTWLRGGADGAGPCR
jgi:hypothetical protein